MGKTKSNPKRKLLGVAGVFMVVLLFTVALAMRSHDDPAQNSLKSLAESTLQQEIAKLGAPLTAMGFDTKKVQTNCYKGADQLAEPVDLVCTATIDSYQVLGKDKERLAKINDQALSLSNLLDKNGWKQREDLKTIDWFKNISKGVDYQPDQLNTKQIGEISCTVDFFTAFSKPAPIAITLKADCSHPGSSAFNLD